MIYTRNLVPGISGMILDKKELFRKAVTILEGLDRDLPPKDVLICSYSLY